MYVSHFVFIKSATLKRFGSVNVWACHFSSEWLMVHWVLVLLIVIIYMQLWGAVGRELWLNTVVYS